MFSIVIPSYKRKQCLKNLLQQLSNQSFTDFEVTVVEQGEKSGLKPPDNRFNFYFLEKPSIVRAKNFGIGKAKGDTILILDDDVNIPCDLLYKYHNQYNQYNSYSIAGPALEKEQFIIKRGGESFGEFSIVGELNTDYRKIKNPVLVTAVPGGNLSFKKECWEKIGGYDENFIGNCINEDSDFCIRLSNAFGKILFSPDLAVNHLRAPQGSRAFGNTKSAKWYEHLFYNHLYFYLKHWPKIYLPFFFLYRMRQVYTCTVRYGRLSTSYVFAPLIGYTRAFKVQMSKSKFQTDTK